MLRNTLCRCDELLEYPITTKQSSESSDVNPIADKAVKLFGLSPVTLPSPQFLRDSVYLNFSLPLP